MRVFDLTHMITEDINVWPGCEAPRLRHIEGGGFRETEIFLNSHNGTHMDAPAHMIDGGATLDTLPASAFCGRAYIMDCTALEAGDAITLERLKPLRLDGVDFLIISTGWEIYWGREEYFGDYPVLSPTAAEYLAALPIKGVGLDTMSVDRMSSRDSENHRLLLGAGKLIIENLRSLAELRQEYVDFSALPLKFQNADGSPVRAIARLG